MNKNRNFLKSLLVALIGAGAMISVSQAVTLKINYEQLNMNTGGQLSTGNVSPIHFADNGNSFGGFFYFKDDVAVGKSAYEWEDDNPERSCACKGPNGNPLLDSEGNPIQFCETDPSNPSTNIVYSCDEDNHEILDEPAPYSVSIVNGETYNCRSQVKGFYYNSQRGERLWPLDKETLEAWTGTAGGNLWNDVTLEGGIYTRCSMAGYDFEGILTRCESEPDPDECINKEKETYYDTHAYYGSVTHEYQDQKWGLIMGVNYKKGSPWIEVDTGNLKLSSTFQRIGNNFPVGFIYDYNGGLGFVGCRVTSTNALESLLDKIGTTGTIQDSVDYDPKAATLTGMINYNGLDCSDVGSTSDSLIRMIVNGLVGMGTNTNPDSVIGNTTSDKMQYFGSVNVNNATLINFTKQKAESLCRGKWVNDLNKCGNNENICCIDNNNNANSIEAPKNKTLIVKNGNVRVMPVTGSNDTSYYDIFVDGDLLVDEGENDQQFVIGRNGFITNEGVGQFDGNVTDVLDNQGALIYDGTGVAVASVLRGNFIVNGGIRKVGSSNAELKNKYFIYGKFTTKKSYEELQDIFKRKCNDGIGTDGHRCPQYDIDQFSKNKSSYRNAFLVVIDQNYDSPLFW